MLFYTLWLSLPNDGEFPLKMAFFFFVEFIFIFVKYFNSNLLDLFYILKINHYKIALNPPFISAKKVNNLKGGSQSINFYYREFLFVYSLQKLLIISFITPSLIAIYLQYFSLYCMSLIDKRARVKY